MLEAAHHRSMMAEVSRQFHYSDEGMLLRGRNSDRKAAIGASVFDENQLVGLLQPVSGLRAAAYELIDIPLRLVERRNN